MRFFKLLKSEFLRVMKDNHGWLPIVAAALSMASASKKGEEDAHGAADANNLSNTQRKAAQGALEGYGYEMYDSPYSSFYDHYINNYLNGGLSEGQESSLAQANTQGLSNVNTTMANRGGTIGGQLAMTQKHNQDMSNQRLQLQDQNTATGLSLAQGQDAFNAAQWQLQQNAANQYKELMAQYAPGEDVTVEKRDTLSKIFDPGGFFS
jgi:hypothetical protein